MKLATPPKLLTVEDTARLLGFKESTIRQKIFDRKIDYVKIGYSVRVPSEVIDRIIETGHKPALGEQNRDWSDLLVCRQCQRRLARIYEQCRRGDHQDRCFLITLASESIDKTGKRDEK